MKGDDVVRMVPYKDGGANEGHSCVKGRFAWGYATHKDRLLKPMIREQINDPWREVTWDEAIDYAAARFKEIQAKHGRGSIGGITSSRCTNEEVYVVQKMIRTAFGNNNVDTCARVCHSPTGYGLKQTFGTSAGTQDFKLGRRVRRHRHHRRQPDRRPPGVRVADEEAPARGRQAHRRRSAPHRHRALAACRGCLSPAAPARHQCRGRQCLLACDRHRRARRPRLRRRALRPGRVRAVGSLHPRAPQLAGSARTDHRRQGRRRPRRGAPLCRRPAMAPSITAWASPSTARARPWSWRMANLAMATGNIGRDGVGRQSAARPEQCPGLLRHGLVPA